MAARYRKLFPQFYRNADVRKLSRSEKLIAIYIITGEQTNRIGLFPFSIGMMCEDLDYELKEGSEGLHNVCKILSWRYDAESRMLLIPTWFRWQCPANVKAMAGAMKDLQQFPRIALAAEWYESAVKTTPEQFHKSIEAGMAEAGYSEDLYRMAYRIGQVSEQKPISVGSGMPYQEQEQEQELEQYQYQEQEQEQNQEREQEHQESATHSSESKSLATPVTASLSEELQSIQTAWNEMATANTLPTIQRMSEPRKKATMARVREMGLDTVLAMIDRVPTCPHLIGQNDRGWTASFDWAIKPANFDKIIEGNYDRKANDSRNASGNGNGMVRKISADGEEQFYR